jgi:hypothetical protein
MGLSKGVHVIDLIEQIDHAGSPLNGLIELKMKMRGVFDDDPAGKLMLKVLALVRKLLQSQILLPLGTNGTDEDMCVLQIGSDIDGADGDQGCLKPDIPANDHA